ncbi:MAG: diguanylate cyclase [Novosphingobium sp.]
MDQSDMMEPGEALQSLDHALEAASRAEKRLREAIEVLPQGIVFLDENDRYILWNKRYSEIYERSADLLEPGVRLADTLRIGVERGDYPEALGREEEWIAERLTRLQQPGVRHEQWLANGRCIMIEERKVDGCGTIGIRVDITDLKQKEENFRLLFERNPLAMLVYDVDTGLIRAANESACTFFGYEREEMAGLPAQALFPEAVQSGASAMLATDYSDSNACWQMLQRDGSSVEAVVATRLSRLEGYSATIVSIFDVTERRRIEQRMTHMARHDELTGLANRAHCREHLVNLLEETAGKQTVTIALVDLDHFKAVNDTYGHMFGDAVLTEAARRMLKLIPPNALLCRIGGDEFAIIFRGSSLAQAELVAKSVITTLTEPFFVHGHLIHIGATVGFASSPGDSRDPETLLR